MIVSNVIMCMVGCYDGVCLWWGVSMVGQKLTVKFNFYMHYLGIQLLDEQRGFVQKYVECKREPFKGLYIYV